jgi:hypothetical protein
VTVSSTTRQAGPFSGNGVTTAFPFNFKVFSSADVRVTYTTAAGVESTLTLGSQYTIALNGDQDNNPGGTVTYPKTGSVFAVLPVGDFLTLTGSLAETQPTDLPNLGPFFAQVIENALDRGVILTQQLDIKYQGAIRFPVSDPMGLSAVLPSAAQRANKAVVFDASGNAGVSENDFEDQAAAAAASAAAAAGSAGAAAASATAAAGSAASAAADRAQANTSAGAAALSASQAQTIAQSGAGFTNATAYDFGSVADPIVLFPTDLGSVP